MDRVRIDRVVKAIVDGVDSLPAIAARAEVDPAELGRFAAEVERAVSLLRGFYRFGHENMQPAGMPPPKNPYIQNGEAMELQPPEYYAYEAVSRGHVDRDRCLWICGQFGVEPGVAGTAIDNVCMPWRAANGWRTYVRERPDGHYELQDKPPVKLKRHLGRLLETLSEKRD
jgi:hypothetical protein